MKLYNSRVQWKNNMKQFWNGKSPGGEPSNMVATSHLIKQPIWKFLLNIHGAPCDHHFIGDPHVGRLQSNQGKIVLQVGSSLINATGSLYCGQYLPSGRATPKVILSRIISQLQRKNLRWKLERILFEGAGICCRMNDLVIVTICFWYSYV